MGKVRSKSPIFCFMTLFCFDADATFAASADDRSKYAHATDYAAAAIVTGDRPVTGHGYGGSQYLKGCNSQFSLTHITYSKLVRHKFHTVFQKTQWDISFEIQTDSILTHNIVYRFNYKVYCVQIQIDSTIKSFDNIYYQKLRILIVFNHGSRMSGFVCSNTLEQTQRKTHKVKERKKDRGPKIFQTAVNPTVSPQVGNITLKRIGTLD